MRYDSLREILIGMLSEVHKLQHLGIDYMVKRCTISEVNNRRDSDFFAQLSRVGGFYVTKMKKNQQFQLKEILFELICGAPYNSYVAKSVEDLKEIVDTSKFKNDFDNALNQIQIVPVNDSTWHGIFELYGEKYTIPIKNSYQEHFEFPIYLTEITIKENTQPSKPEIIDWIRKLGFYKGE